MIKLSKTSRLLLAAGIFAILGASLGVAYAQQAREQSQLNQELSLAQVQFNQLSTEKLSSQQKELERRLTRAESGLKTAKAKLSRPNESIEASDTLFDIAKNCNVEITQISSSAPTSKELEGVTFCVLPLTVQIEGDVTSLIDFVLEWTREYSTGVVNSVEMTVSEPTEIEEGENEGGSEGKSSANIRMLIYTYRGD